MAVAAVAGAATGPGAWYAALEKPPLQPPNWLFGPAWALLYALIALSTSRVMSERAEASEAIRLRRVALALFGINLALNFAWSFLFFSLKLVAVAALEIVFVLGTAVAMAVVYGRLRPVLGVLLAPYVAWLAFATYLNFGILALNGAG